MDWLSRIAWHILSLESGNEYASLLDMEGNNFSTELRPGLVRSKKKLAPRQTFTGRGGPLGISDLPCWHAAARVREIVDLPVPAIPLSQNI